MPLIDVTDLLYDPDFTDSITVKSTTRTIGANGRTVDVSSSPSAIVAVVVPVAQRLILQSDGALKDGAIDIYTVYRLSGGVKTSDTASRLPDVVTWHGREYVVASVDDYTAFGAGFIKATANLSQINPGA